MEKLNIKIDTVYFNDDGIDTFTTITSVNEKPICWSNSDNAEDILPEILKYLGYDATVKRLINGE